jgi:hypothetical protein
VIFPIRWGGVGYGACSGRVFVTGEDACELAGEFVSHGVTTEVTRCLGIAAGFTARVVGFACKRYTRFRFR